MIMSAFRFKKISQIFIATAFVIGICWPKSMAQTNRQQLEQKRRKVELEIAENKKILLSKHLWEHRAEQILRDLK